MVFGYPFRGLTDHIGNRFMILKTMEITKVFKNHQYYNYGHSRVPSTGQVSEHKSLFTTRESAISNWSRTKPKRPQMHPTYMRITRVQLGYAGDWKDLTLLRREHFSEYIFRASGRTSPESTPHYIDRESSSSDDQVALALLRARSNLASSDLNLGESLVELSDTARMITHRTQTLYQMFTAVRKGDWKTLSNLLRSDVPTSLRHMPVSKRLASGHLEVIYGWTPLINDIYGGISVLQKGFADRGTVIRRSGSSYDADPMGNGAGAPLGAKVTLHGLVSSKNVLALNQLGLLNPALMAWNNLPFSFVLDWFIPVSTVLQSLTYHLGLSKVVGTVTTVTRFESGRGVLGRYKSEEFITRSPLHDVTVNWRPQNLWSPSLSVSKVAASVSLLRSLGR